MTAARPEKKSETLEVRLPHAAKTAFMARCQAEGRTASDTVRGFITSELAGGHPARTRSRAWQALAAAFVGLVLGAVAAPSLAQTATAHASFEALDANHDGVLTPAEYAR